MTAFNDLPEAGTSQGTDQLAVTRGNATLRQTIARIIAAARDGLAQLAGATFTGAVRGIAPTAADHLTRRDFVESLASEVWAEIAAGTTIPVKKIVTHGGLYFACIAEHQKGATGPDGDADNWLVITNFAGPWSNKWWPRGTFVTHGGYPYVSTAVVPVNSPAPNAATNVLWLLLGTIPPGVVSYNANTIITAAQRGFTFRATGDTTRLLSLPNASGAGEVENGWDVSASNGSTADQSIRPNGADTIGGNAGLTIAPGRVVTLRKVATGVWIIATDTKDETGGDGAAFMPSKANLYEAVKAIFVHNSAVSADDPNNELDFAAGAAGALADNSIPPIKILANRDVDKKSFRARVGSVSVVGVANELPAVANHNVNDLAIVWRGGATTVPFRELDAPAVELTDTVAGDLIQLYPAGWTRVSNLFSGGIAAAAARDIAESNRDRLMVSLTQGDFYGGSAAAIQGTYHINVESMPGAFPTANKVEVWIGDPGISRVLSQSWSPAEIQRNLEFEIDATVADNIATNGLVDIGDELGIEIRLIAPGAVELYRKGFDFPVIVEPRAIPAAPAVVQAYTAAAVAVNTNAEFTVAEARITPRGNTTRVRVQGLFDASVQVGGQAGWDLRMRLRLYRGNTLIDEREGGQNHAPQQDGHFMSLFGMAVDTPASAVEQTYTLRALRQGQATPWSVVRRRLVLEEVL